MTSTMQTLTTPPGKPTPYVLPCYTGEIWTIPTSNSILRLLVTGNETDNAFAVVSSAGQKDKPIGFHYHREAHDVFLCLKGELNIWANDKARTLGPGDFASVPPNTIHQYQIASSHTEFVGLIIPGGWEEFFRFIGEPYSGPMFPTNDNRNPFQVLIPKLIAATEKFDMVPVREKQHFDPQPWDGTEVTLPGKCENGGYFLKHDAGEKKEVAGSVLRALATRKETDGRFSIYSYETSSMFKAVAKQFKFDGVHHAVQTVDGTLTVVIEGQETNLGWGETAFVPAGSAFSLKGASSYARAYIFANGGGFGEVLMNAGKKYEGAVVPAAEDASAFDESAVAGLKEELGFSLI